MLAHKPALIIAVSSSDGGAYPVAELRMSSYKNTRICDISEQIIARHVESVLNDDLAQNNTGADDSFRRRIMDTGATGKHVTTNGPLTCTLSRPGPHLEARLSACIISTRDARGRGYPQR